MRRSALPFAFFMLLAASALPHSETVAQSRNPRFGLGFNTLVSTAEGLGVGLRGRASAPVNTDLSLAVDFGFTGFVFEGRRDATYLFDPQVSAIITLPSDRRRVPYVLFGFGGYVPFGDNDEGSRENGPTLHGGMGWVVPLNETSLFYEINPAVVVGENRVHLALPFRIGLIF